MNPAHAPSFRARALLLLLLGATAAPAAGALPETAWPGQRTAQDAAAVPAVIFAHARPVAVAAGPTPAAIVATLRTLPLTGRLAASGGASGTVAIGAHLLRPGDRLPAALLPTGFPPVYLHTVASGHWTIMVHDTSQPPWSQDLPLTQLRP